EENGILGRGFVSGDHGYLGRYREFKRSIPLWHRDYVNIDGSFVRIELIPEFKSDIREFNRAMGTAFADWSAVTLPETCPAEGSALAGLRPFWLHYVKDVLNVHHIRLNPSAESAYRDMLRGRGTPVPEGESSIPKLIPDSGRIVDDYTFFIENLAQPEDLSVRTIANDFRAWLMDKYADIESLNSMWQNELGSFEAVRLSATLPHSSIYAQDDWLEYVKSQALQHLSIMPAAQTEYVAFLKSAYADAEGKLDLAKLNRDLGTDYDDEINIFAPGILPEHPKQRELWTSFVRGHVSPLHMKLLVTPQSSGAYAKFIKDKYGDVALLNQAWHLKHASFAAIPYPIDQIDYLAFSQNVPGIRWEFIKRNYVMVLDQMLNDARSLRNTLIYCLLSILMAITVNPLAAYALSRFKPRFGYQMIMLFMLTMAFPAMVMGIPNFLMLKRLNMLNTFWALILPAAADGYFIFLLKGFFDSLPRELYESARLDGAGEFRLFWQFTLYLSKPILAVIALGAFNAAYRNFLFAFIVCQDQSMWILMVHIYELMQRASPSVGYAALVIAAIPTLAVFIFFQNIIIKGIVVPMEK
ncbi:MAG: carbohydrate ABC transporter permease, partial [Candidatus Cloacimonadaceae bacterium]|nr:carbohydrate ABC transporter permease [Candidatus Cloacimonadaceae bacterium]